MLIFLKLLNCLEYSILNRNTFIAFTTFIFISVSSNICSGLWVTVTGSLRTLLQAHILVLWYYCWWHLMICARRRRTFLVFFEKVLTVVVSYETWLVTGVVLKSKMAKMKVTNIKMFSLIFVACPLVEKFVKSTNRVYEKSGKEIHNCLIWYMRNCMFQFQV